MAKSLGDSKYTSIKERIEAESTDLLSFGKGDDHLPYYLSSYIDLVDETGRIIRDGAYMDIGVSREQDAEATKKGYISQKLGSALTKLELNSDTWLDELQGFKSVGYSAVGTVSQLREYSQKTKRKWSVGIRLQPALE